MLKISTGIVIEVIKTIAPKWKRIGDFLEFDATGSQLYLIDANNKGVEACCRAMFQYWLQGNGKTPTSWNTLIVILNDCNFRALASQLRAALKP